MAHDHGVGAVGVRIAGLSTAALDSLRCAKAVARVHEILALDEWLAREASALSDALYESIGTLAVPDLRPRLVGLRRALHAGRRPPTHLFDEATRRALPEALVARIRGWDANRNERAALDETLRDELRADVSSAAAALRETVSSPTMLLGLVYSNPDVFREARRWLARPGARPADKTATRLARYVSRAAAKTSPLTLYTSSGIGSWRAGGPALTVREPDVHSIGELDVGLLARLVGDLANRPAVAARMPVRVNPSATVDGEVVRFVARGPVGSVQSVRFSPALNALLTHAREGYTLDELRRGLTAKAADAEHTDRIAAFVDRLLELGILELHLPIPDQRLDPHAVLGWLDEHADALGDDHELAELRGTLRQLTACLDGYPRSTDTAHRLEQRRRIEVDAAQLTRSADRARASGGTAAFFESAVLTGEAVIANRREWTVAVDDLATVARLGELYDPALPVRLALPTFVEERYGAGARIPLLRFYAEYQAELTAGQLPGEAAARRRTVVAEDVDPARAFATALSTAATRAMAASPIPELAELGRLRAMTTELLDRRPARRGDGIGISPAELARTADGVAALSRTDEGSLACYVQPYFSGGDVHLVVNAIRFGLGTGRTRIAHLIDKTFGAAVPRASRPEPSAAAGPIHAEIESVCGSALNQRAPATEYVLGYPGTVSERPAGQQIPLGELTVVHDGATKRVRLEWERHGREVAPVHLGLGTAAMLPPLLYFLINAFGRSSYYFTPALLTPGALDAGQPGRATAMHSWPRLCAGRVTFRRAGWWLAATAIPRRAAGEADHAFLLRLARWRAETGLPDRCFIRVLRGDWPVDGTRGARIAPTGPADPLAAFTPWLSKERKPLYIDFGSWHLVQVFERMVADASADLMVEEALPALADAPRTEGGERRVLELILEVPLGPTTMEAFGD